MAKETKKLVIVESPAKAKTIGKFLGSQYKVVASVGHVRDLPKSKLGIDIENNFEPEYIPIRGKGDVIKTLKKEAKDASRVYLATDHDREGEAISFHLAHLLSIKPEEPVRVVFNEITKDAIKEAIKEPRPVKQSTVDAQQARRVLDRLVGYQISPLLWRKIRRGLSAGRVQSAALKIIIDREKEIQNFIPEKYWLIDLDLSKKTEDTIFKAKLTEYKGEKLTLDSVDRALEAKEALLKGENIVISTEKKNRTRRPYAPYTTSTLQQDAGNKLSFNIKRTMMVAQQLYEGCEVKGHGALGLVTYIRTDSVRISDQARMSAKSHIIEKYGEKYWSNNFYSNRKKDVQDAHEAIRPSRVDLVPEDIKGSLTRDQYLLYKLIYSRFLASQMAEAVFDNEAANIKNGDYTLRATGSKLLFNGFLKVYSDKREEDEDKTLPRLEQGEELLVKGLNLDEKETQPPFRFTEASLVKDLEDRKIGRPSTYSPIISTLLERKYVEREKRTLVPTELGFVVTDMMEEYFNEIVDPGFTSEMEDNLDRIESSNAKWKDVVADYYAILKEEIKVADEKIEKVELKEEFTGENCDLCGKPMVIKHGRFGPFAACSGYPECKRTKPIVKGTGVPCPSCGKELIARKGKSGKIFYGCSGYPECTQVFWNKPVKKQCPECNSILLEKKSKNHKLECSNPECGYKE
ncbi:MAG: type I DNA topoisomerase [Anaerovoracaceae bacterium]|nr:type I DNA topoisomerase [Clostridiales bacterium]